MFKKYSETMSSPGGEKPVHSDSDSQDSVDSDSWGSSCLLLADHEDIEALATCHVLRNWMFPHLLQKRIHGPVVLSPAERIMELGYERTKYLLIVCTKGCFESISMIRWLIQAYHFAQHCRVFPIIADEEFQVPGAAVDFHNLASNPNVLSMGSEIGNLASHSSSFTYHAVTKALFAQIASRFSARYSSESTLKGKAAGYAQRLSELQTLSSLLSTPGFSGIFEDTINQFGSLQR